MHDDFGLETLFCEVEGALSGQLDVPSTTEAGDHRFLSDGVQPPADAPPPSVVTVTDLDWGKAYEGCPAWGGKYFSTQKTGVPWPEGVQVRPNVIEREVSHPFLAAKVLGARSS